MTKVEFSKDDWNLMERILRYAEPNPRIVTDLVGRSRSEQLRLHADQIEKQEADIRMFVELCNRIRSELAGSVQEG